MSSSVDRAIAKGGNAATIIRTAGNVTTSLYVEAKLKTRAYSSMPFEKEAMFPSTSGVTCGDLVLSEGVYYLVINVHQDKRVGKHWLDRARLFVCNHTVNISNWNAATKKVALSKSNVPTLIINQNNRMMVAGDRAIAVPGMAGDKDSVFYLYVQESTGLTKESEVKQGTRKLKIAGNINPYFVDGLLEVPVKIEE